ncbi:HNH endonuclease, partial [Arthrobacter sp. AQ5-05]|uniref:HNH endonuclease signature motif containing protein n=1 Tax=Arthrobacter sp. AQ5-05 TaxID=2184581 RepID=UPI000DCC2449
MTITAPTGTPRGPTPSDTAIRQLAGAVLALRAAQERLGAADLDAASAALVLGLYEQGNRAVAFGQLRTVFAADALQVHRLDPGTAAAIDALAADPRELAAGTAPVPAEAMCQGMAPHRTTGAWMQSHLHISGTEARRRLAGARLLVAPVPPAPGAATEPGAAPGSPAFPILARAAADGAADVGTLAQLAGKLDSMGPRIAARPDAANLAEAIERDLARELGTNEPQHGHKALADWGAYLAENGAPVTDEEIISRRGMFFKGNRGGCDEYLLRCDPIDSEAIRAFGEAWTNPRSAKLPPTSASSSRSTTGTGIGAPEPDEQPAARESGDTPGNHAPPKTTPAGTSPPETTDPGTAASLAGTPAPAWALAPGTDPADAPRSAWDCGPAASENGPSFEGGDRRTSPQLLLDGIIAAIGGALEGTGVPESGGLRIRIGVLIGYRALLGQCEDAGITDHGRPISAANIRRLACNGDLLPALLGEEGEILDLGREVRGFSPAQRKAIAIRDRGCVVPGCRRPASTNEAHHVKPWQEGGETSVDNGANTCSHHHLMIHAGLITLKMINGIPYVVARAGQPRGDPERNLYWHPELRTAGYTPPMFT